MENFRTGSGESEIRILYANAYIKFLETYKENVKNSTNNKIKLKNRFFIAMCVMIGVAAAIFLVTAGISFYLFICMVNKNYRKLCEKPTPLGV